MVNKIKADYQRVSNNFQTLRFFLQDLKAQMSTDIVDIYSKLNQLDNKDEGQGFVSDLFWSAFNLITTIETLQGKELIAWILGAIVQDIHDHIDNYPTLDKEIDQFLLRFTNTLNAIEDKIAPIISDPQSHWNDVYVYGKYTIKVSDFDTFDFLYGGVDYQKAQDVVQEQCKMLALKNCFPYDRWKIAFWFGESPQANPCKQCNSGCDGYQDERGFIEDINAPILDNEGRVIAKDAYDYINVLLQDKPSYFYVLESTKAINCRFPQYSDPNDIKNKYPNGAYLNEYLMLEGRDNFLNTWTEFDNSVARWMFKDMNGFVDRTDLYYNWGLDASSCIWKRQYNPDPNSENWVTKVVKYFTSWFK
jgi:hypothetical protein